MKATAIVVDTPKMAKALNKILPSEHKAFAVKSMKAGYRFDQILVIATMASDEFSEWFDHFVCCLAPDGEIIYD
jgi:hypothetical protein